MRTKTIDTKGRLSLGSQFAGKTVMVEEHEDELVLRFANVVPTGEAWLWENKNALGAVQRGLAQAREGELVEGPDLAASFAFADEIPDK
jgi:hypothetical protein